MKVSEFEFSEPIIVESFEDKPINEPDLIDPTDGMRSEVLMMDESMFNKSELNGLKSLDGV